ncbi:MAG: hypothetical protein ACFFDF_17150 [Candidatus Odinarchaeota archaeon]
MHEKVIKFVVEYCRPVCPKWAHCISTSKGFEKGDTEDIKCTLFCLKSVEREIAGKEINEEEIEQEISTIDLEAL